MKQPSLMICLTFILVAFISKTTGLSCYECTCGIPNDNNGETRNCTTKNGTDDCLTRPKKEMLKTCPKESTRCISVSASDYTLANTTTNAGRKDNGTKPAKQPKPGVFVRKCATAEENNGVLSNIYSPIGCMKIMSNKNEENSFFYYTVGPLNMTIGTFCYCKNDKCNKDLHSLGIVNNWLKKPGTGDSVHHGLKILILLINGSLLYGGSKIIF